jgi:DNA repair protein RadC
MTPDLPGGERPRERLRDRGPAYLSNAELLAILLRTGSAGESVLDMALRLLTAEMVALEQIGHAWP